MKKEYISAEIELMKLDTGDVLTASGGGGPIEPGVNPENPFEGGYDSDGWT